MPTCSTCNSSSATKLCSNCKCVYYCDSKCQRKNWREHKKICNTLKNSNQNKIKRVHSISKTNENVDMICSGIGNLLQQSTHTELCNDKNTNTSPFCRYYFTPKGCKFSTNCKFRHKYHREQNSLHDQSDPMIFAAFDIITAISKRCVEEEYNIDSTTQTDETMITLIHKKANQIKTKMHKFCGKNNNKDMKLFTKTEEMLKDYIFLELVYQTNGGLEDLRNTLQQVHQHDEARQIFGRFNSIVVMSEISRRMTFYEEKFKQKNAYNVSEFGEMFCQFFYVCGQRKVLVDMLANGDIFCGPRNEFSEWYLQTYDKGGYNGVIPAMLCDELASQSVKPWDETSMAMIGMLHMHKFQCVKK